MTPRRVGHGRGHGRPVHLLRPDHAVPHRRLSRAAPGRTRAGRGPLPRRRPRRAELPGHRPADRPQGAGHRRRLRHRPGCRDRLRPGGRRRRPELPAQRGVRRQGGRRADRGGRPEGRARPRRHLRGGHRPRPGAHHAGALGGIDIVANVAGKQTYVDDLADVTTEQFDATFKTNVYATVLDRAKEALPHLPPGSTIINTSSIQAYQPSPGLVDYATTKAAINTLSKALAQQLAPEGHPGQRRRPRPVLDAAAGQRRPAARGAAGVRPGDPARAAPGSRPSSARPTSSSPRRSPATSAARPSTSTAGCRPRDVRP